MRDAKVTGVQTCALLFSSRRRHTRCLSDWSSDVCSSDLYPARRQGIPAHRQPGGIRHQPRARRPAGWKERPVTMKTTIAVSLLLSGAALAQDTGANSFRGMVRLNRAPVSNEVLKVKLPRP